MLHTHCVATVEVSLVVVASLLSLLLPHHWMMVLLLVGLLVLVLVLLLLLHQLPAAPCLRLPYQQLHEMSEFHFGSPAGYKSRNMISDAKLQTLGKALLQPAGQCWQQDCSTNSNVTSHSHMLFRVCSAIT